MKTGQDILSSNLSIMATYCDVVDVRKCAFQFLIRYDLVDYPLEAGYPIRNTKRNPVKLI